MKTQDVYKIVMKEFRCSECNRLLFKGKIHSDYRIEIKCPRCKTLTGYEKKTTK